MLLIIFVRSVFNWKLNKCGIHMKIWIWMQHSLCDEMRERETRRLFHCHLMCVTQIEIGKSSFPVFGSSKMENFIWSGISHFSHKLPVYIWYSVKWLCLYSNTWHILSTSKQTKIVWSEKLLSFRLFKRLRGSVCVWCTIKTWVKDIA